MSYKSKAVIKSNGEAIDLSEMRIIRKAKGQPTLLVIPTSNYNWIWNDSGGGAHGDCSIYRPAPTDPTFCIVGDYAQGNYASPTGPTLVVKSLNDEGEPMPLLMPPTGWRQIWNDQGSHGDHDGSIWMAVPKDGYVALGAVGQAGYDTPNIPNYRCVRADFTTKSQAGAQIWNDGGSGAHGDVILFQNAGVDGIFLAQADHNPYTGPVYAFKS